MSFIRADIKNQAIELKKEKLDDDVVMAVLKKQQKRLLDAKESIGQSQRNDLIESLDKELVLLAGYLPQPLSDDELLKVVDEILVQTGASTMKDMGRVMKEVLARVGVRADSKQVSSLVKQKLNAP